MRFDRDCLHLNIEIFQGQKLMEGFVCDRGWIEVNRKQRTLDFTTIKHSPAQTPRFARKSSSLALYA